MWNGHSQSGVTLRGPQFREDSPSHLQIQRLISSTSDSKRGTLTHSAEPLPEIRDSSVHFWRDERDAAAVGAYRELSGGAEGQEDAASPELSNGSISEFRELKSHGGSTFIQSFINGVNVLAGIGILSTPYATAGGGWLSLLLLAVFACACCYTGLLLRACMDLRPRTDSYPDIGEAAFGCWGRWLTALLLYSELFAVAVELLILEADNLAHLFPDASASVLGLHLSPQLLFLLLSAAVVLPTVWLRDLSVLAYVSASGVLSTLLVVLGVAWVGSFDGVGFGHRGRLLRFSGLPAAAGLFGFCFSGHAVVPNLYKSMRNPSQFKPVLVLSFATCLALYGGVAVCGYVMFGDGVKEQITLNLPQGFIATNVVIWTTVITPFTKYALTITPLVLGLEEALLGRMDDLAGAAHCSVIRRHRWRILVGGTAIRTSLVTAGVAVAALVPFFGLVMAFIGSFLSLSISVVFPCVFYLKLAGPQLSRLERVGVLLVLALGLVSAAAGTYYSVCAITRSWQPPKLLVSVLGLR